MTSSLLLIVPALMALSSVKAQMTSNLIGAADEHLPIQKMYVPLPDATLLDDVFEKINSKARSPVNDMISIAISTEGTIIWYDHWEDGFEADVLNPVGADTEIWGDGNPANGCARVFDAPNVQRPCNKPEDDILHPGDVIILENEVAIPRNKAVTKYDGGDLLISSRPCAMTRAAFPAGAGSLMAGAVEVFEEAKWGTEFVAPVGTDLFYEQSVWKNKYGLSAGMHPYQYSALSIMAGEDGTKLYKDGSSTPFDTLKQGENKLISVEQGDKITSSLPVQVHLITGDINSNYELRWYALPPADQWASEAYAPVGDTKGETKVTVYNPGTTSIQVDVTKKGGAKVETLSIPGGRHARSKTIPDGVACKFKAKGSNKFFAFSSTDTEGSTQIFDWGYPLMTSEMVTPEVLIGMGFGCTHNNCGTDDHGERSVVWVTPVKDATVYVDFDNDGTADKTIDAQELESIMLTDEYEKDEDMSGAVIWAEDASGKGVNIAAAWGQKAALSKSNDFHALDLGTVIVPFEQTRTSCSVSWAQPSTEYPNGGDLNGNNIMDAGDIVVQTILVINAGQIPIQSDEIAVETFDGPRTIPKSQARGGGAKVQVTITVPESTEISPECETKIVPAPDPTDAPTDSPTTSPTASPTGGPTASPTVTPTSAPTSSPTAAPTSSPTAAPTMKIDPPDAPEPTASPGVNGDPHFKTFAGEMYDFHGECDLVLLHNPAFKNGLGMDVHVRTKIQDFWSSVETAVLRVGDATVEITANPDADEWLWINGTIVTGIKNGKWGRDYMEGHLVRYKQSSKGVREVNIYLQGYKEKMLMKTFKSFVRVDVPYLGSDNYHGSNGLLGSYDNNGARLGRDGKAIKDLNKFGQEWQVLESEPKLFHSYDGAVVGRKCVMPPSMTKAAFQKLRQRRLSESSLSQADAEKACDHLRDPEEVKACVFDVLATQDLDMAGAW